MNVKNVQKQLNIRKAGELAGVGALVEDGILGAKTTAAIKAFQQSVGILADGLAGADTLAALAPKTNQPNESPFSLHPMNANSLVFSLRAMEIAINQNGIRELTGNNDGPAVETFLSSVGLPKGYAWCMAFVYWCYNQAAIQLGVMNPLVRTAGCLRQWNEIPAKYKYSHPKAGDIFIMDLGKGAGHTGIVVKLYEDGTFDTVEGNTNTNGSANGDGVYLRKRKIGGKIKGYIRC